MCNKKYLTIATLALGLLFATASLEAKDISVKCFTASCSDSAIPIGKSQIDFVYLECKGSDNHFERNTFDFSSKSHGAVVCDLHPEDLTQSSAKYRCYNWNPAKKFEFTVKWNCSASQ